MDINSLILDQAAINDGTWVSDIPGMGDVRLKVRGMRADAVTELRARKTRALPKDQRGRDGAPNAAATKRILKEVLHEAVLLDWDGMADGGKPVPYDAARAKEWLTDPRFERFADAVVAAANYVDEGESGAIEDAAGN